MIVRANQIITKEEFDSLKSYFTEKGFEIKDVSSDTVRLFGVIGDTSKLDIDDVRNLKGVLDVTRIQAPDYSKYRNENSKKVLIVGLGLMGGAYAQRLYKKGYYVYGTDLNQNSIDYAINNNYIIDGSKDPEKYIEDIDIIILCIYPKAIMSFLEKYKDRFNENQLITDICGVKTSFVKDATRLALPARYLSHHPMAGREKIGIEYSSECIFEGANFIITPVDESLDEDIKLLNQLGLDLGFKRITVIDINKHDRMIGFTSQLTHAIAVSLVNSDRDVDTKNYIGDSYRDLTRIAMINESLWSELFLENRIYLLNHINSFEKQLNLLKEALLDDDKEALKKLFISSTKIRKEMEK